MEGITIEVMQARALIAKQMPALMLDKITPIPEGGDTFTFSVNDSLIIKFPVSALAAERLINEKAFLEASEGKLGSYVSKIIFQGCPCREFPFPFTVQQMLEGVSGEKK